MFHHLWMGDEGMLLPGGVGSLNERPVWGEPWLATAGLAEASDRGGIRRSTKLFHQ